MWRYPESSAAWTASRVSSGGVWKTPRPSAGISTPLLSVIVSISSTRIQHATTLVLSPFHLSRSDRPGKAEAGVLWVVVEGYPYLFSARDDLRRRVSGRGSGRRLIPKRSWRLPGSGGRRSASRLVSSPSGGEFELAGGVEGAFADL